MWCVVGGLLVRCDVMVEVVWRVVMWCVGEMRCDVCGCVFCGKCCVLTNKFIYLKKLYL